MSIRMDTQGSVYKGRDATGLEHFVAELYADETSDIAGVTVFKFEGGQIIVDPNSTAYVVRTGKLYVMGGDNKWYDTDGNEVE